MIDDPNVPAIAKLLRARFPELEQRAFAIMEADLTKENMPNLPLAFVALLGLAAENQSNDVKTPLDLLETICIEFWFEPKTYKLMNGGVSPFYAYQPYDKIMERLFAALNGFFTPVKKGVRFISMSTSSDEFALMISFKVSIKWRWCAEMDDEANPIRIAFNVDPHVMQLPGGKDYIPPDECTIQGHALPVPPVI